MLLSDLLPSLPVHPSHQVNTVRFPTFSTLSGRAFRFTAPNLTVLLAGKPP
jgi:hypothetical protein